MKKLRTSAAIVALLLAAAGAAAETGEVRIVKQIGLGFLPIMVMEHQKLVEKHARAQGAARRRTATVDAPPTEA